MESHTPSQDQILLETARLVGARFAAWVEMSASEWLFGEQVGLTQRRKAWLARYLSQTRIHVWLAGALANGRVRYRSLDKEQANAECARLYVFPNQASHSAILVGCGELNREAHGFLRIVSRLKRQSPSATDLVVESQVLFRPLETGIEPSYDLQGVLNQVLGFLSTSLSAEKGLIALRSGDSFMVRAVNWEAGNEVEREINLQNVPWLADVVRNRTATLLGADLGKVFGYSSRPSGSWMAVPIVLGQRVIGLAAFYAHEKGRFQETSLTQASLLVERIAYLVENAIIFSEAARYLQQMALMNELAAAAATGSNISEVARRLLNRLRRVFSSGQVSLQLLSTDGLFLSEYRGENIDPVGDELQDLSISQPIEGSLVGWILETSRPVRIGDRDQFPEGLPLPENIRSKLAVPLRYRGRVIGILDLSSSEPDAFSIQDEQLLGMIASHLTGLIENVRLYDETRRRARNLSLIHEVVQKVVGLTDTSAIAQKAARLMVDQFDYDQTLIILTGEGDHGVWTAGVAGDHLPVAQLAHNSHSEDDIVSSVLHDGQPRVENITSPIHSPSATEIHVAGSEMCVPLKDAEHIFGAIVVRRKRLNAFSGNDLLALQALAGVLSSVMMNADRYQQLQTSVRQLEAARETALDIAGDLDLDMLLRRVVRRARELIGARGAELALVNSQTETVRTVVSENPWRDFTGTEVAFMSGIEGRVASLGEPIVIADYNQWSGRLYPERHMPYHAVAGIPLKLKREVIGVLLVSDDRPEREFGTADLHLLELFAAQAAVLIHNARLYQEIQERMGAQRQAEMQLVRSARLAAVGEMAAGVAHELNNPLTTVSGFIELVLEELPPDAAYRQDLELVLREARRARGVVRRLLDFSRPADNLRVQSDVNEIVSEVLTLVQHLVRTNGVELRVQLREELPWISIDPNQIKQVLLNLVHNALQAMPRGGVLSVQTDIQTRQEANWQVISVCDSGEGIKSEDMERIFEPFFTTRPVGSGTGLGLSVSYGIVTEHGGFIDVESLPGRGSCFTIWLPVEKNERK